MASENSSTNMTLVGAVLFKQYVATQESKDAYSKNDVPAGSEEIDRLLYSDEVIESLQQSAIRN